MIEFHAWALIGIAGIVGMTTLQSWILMRVVKRLTELESALSGMWNRILIEDADDPAGSMRASGGLRRESSNDKDRRRSFDGIGCG